MDEVKKQPVWMKGCDIFRGGQNILWPLLHIFRESRPPNPRDLRPRRWTLTLTAKSKRGYTCCRLPLESHGSRVTVELQSSCSRVAFVTAA